MAELGKIPAADIAHVILGLERAIARGCGHILGRPVKTTGRWGVLIEQAVDLRFVRYERGSFGQVFEIPAPPPPPDSLRLEGSALGELGAQIAIAALRSDARDYPDVAQTWLDTAERLAIGSRHESLEITQASDNVSRVATLDRERVERIGADLEELQAFSLRQDELLGVLVEADFESMTARLRTGAGDRVQVAFDPGLSDDIQLALRHQASLVGEVRYSTENATAISVRVRSVKAPEQLEFRLARPAFLEHRHIDQLRRDQRVNRLRAIDDMTHVDLAPDELRAALEALDT